MPPIVLASTSRSRAELLTRLRVPFTTAAPGVDESAAAFTLPPRERAIALARAKADAVATHHPGAIVIGSDQVCACDGAILDKPGTAERARAQLAALRGRRHTLLTAVHLATPHGPRAFVDETHLTMRPLTDAAIARYVDADQPLDCAGSYRIEGLGIALFAAVETRDQTAIVGLPLIALVAHLSELGVELP
jgi:septum formation protein